jgi:hypothetical protein
MSLFQFLSLPFYETLNKDQQFTKQDLCGRTIHKVFLSHVFSIKHNTASDSLFTTTPQRQCPHSTDSQSKTVKETGQTVLPW